MDDAGKKIRAMVAEDGLDNLTIRKVTRPNAVAYTLVWLGNVAIGVYRQVMEKLEAAYDRDLSEEKKTVKELVGKIVEESNQPA